MGMKDILLEADGVPPMSIFRKDEKDIFGQFAFRIHQGAPSEIIQWYDLHIAIRDINADPRKASERLRQRLHFLNQTMSEHMGSPPTGRFVQTVRRRGARLNPQVNWCLSDKLVKLLTGRPYDHATPPKVLEETHANPDDKMLAQSSRPKKKKDDDDDDDE